jgi:hypothetical protein
MCAFGQHRGFGLERCLVGDGVGAPGMRALYDGGAEGGDRLLVFSDVKIYRVTVPPNSVDDIIARIPS